MLPEHQILMRPWCSEPRGSGELQALSDGLGAALHPKTFGFTCESSFNVINGQFLHFVKLNSQLGLSSMGITMVTIGQGQGIRKGLGQPGPQFSQSWQLPH